MSPDHKFDFLSVFTHFLKTNPKTTDADLIKLFQLIIHSYRILAEYKNNNIYNFIETHTLKRVIHAKLQNLHSVLYKMLLCKNCNNKYCVNTIQIRSCIWILETSRIHNFINLFAACMILGCGIA